MKKLLLSTIAAMLLFGSCAEQDQQLPEVVIADYSSKPLDLGAGTWTKHYLTPTTIFLSHDVKAGQKVRIYLSPYELGTDNPWWQLKPYDGHWWPLFSMVYPGTEGSANADNTDISKGYVDIDITDDIAQKLKTNTDWGGAMILQGEYAKINKISLVGNDVKTPEELIVWVGSLPMKEWESLSELGWGKFSWNFLKPGTKIRLYCEPMYEESNDETFMTLRRASDWKELPGIGERLALEQGKEYIEANLSQEAIEDINSNQGLIPMGCNVILTKITLVEPK